MKDGDFESKGGMDLLCNINKAFSMQAIISVSQIFHGEFSLCGL